MFFQNTGSLGDSFSRRRRQIGMQIRIPKHAAEALERMKFAIVHRYSFPVKRPFASPTIYNLWVSPTKFRPMPLGRASAPFTHRDWVFEIKWDGFRCMAFIENGKCRLVSRNGNEFKSFTDLSVTLPQELRNRTAILDGEIVCLNTHGKTEFEDLLDHSPVTGVAQSPIWANPEHRLELPTFERANAISRGELVVFSEV